MPDRLLDLGAFESSRLAEAKRHLRSAVLWPARIAASYAQRQSDGSVPPLTWQRERQAITTPPFDNAIQLELRLPALEMQFLDHGTPVPHILDVDDRSAAHVEAWLLVELLHRGIDRERFSKKLAFDAVDVLTGDHEKFATLDYPAELAALTEWLAMGASVLDMLAPGAAVTVAPQTVTLATRMPSRKEGGVTAGDSRRVIFSLGDAGEPEPYFAVIREAHGTVTPLRPDVVLSASMIRRSALMPEAIAHRLGDCGNTLGAA